MLLLHAGVPCWGTGSELVKKRPSCGPLGGLLLWSGRSRAQIAGQFVYAWLSGCHTVSCCRVPTCSGSVLAEHSQWSKKFGVQLGSLGPDSASAGRHLFLQTARLLPCRCVVNSCKPIWCVNTCVCCSKDPEDWCYGNPWEMTREQGSGPPSLPDTRALAAARRTGQAVLAAPWTNAWAAAASACTAAKRKRNG